MGGSRLREVVAHGGLTVAYEINVQGWKKRLGLEGVGGGAGEGGLGLGLGLGLPIRHTFLKNPTVSRIFQEASHLATSHISKFKGL